MQQSLYREVEQSGGLTTIKVSGAQAGNSMMYSSSGKEEEQSTKYINDQLLAKLSKLNDGPFYYFTTKAPRRYTDIAYPVYLI